MKIAALISFLTASLILVSCAGTSPRFTADIQTETRKERPRKERDHSDNGAINRRELRGVASWYGEAHHGKKTASGEPFDMNAMTAAHRTIPFQTIVEVTDDQTGKSVRVRINDRGPMKRDRVIDLSKKAATKLGIVQRGVAEVNLEIVSE